MMVMHLGAFGTWQYIIPSDKHFLTRHLFKLPKKQLETSAQGIQKKDQNKIRSASLPFVVELFYLLFVTGKCE
jgi:hypothetical protein